MFDVEHPFVKQPDALRIGRCEPAWLQTWVTRGHLIPANPNPGRGRSRLYSAVDVVKIAILSRFAAFGIPVDEASNVADVSGETLRGGGRIDWNDFLPFCFTTLRSSVRSRSIYADGSQDLTLLGVSTAEPEELRVSTFTEWFRGTHRRRDGSLKIVPGDRERLARAGIHAEPFLYFPLGEIVNATLLQVKHLAERDE